MDREELVKEGRAKPSGEREPKRKGKRAPRPLPVIGWREWIALPSLGIPRVKAKIDTGARSSSLHAFGLEEIIRDGHPAVRFRVHPLQRSRTMSLTCEADLLEWRKVRSSSGAEELRPVIVTTAELMGERWDIELTLSRRDTMGFRMLLGRQALRRRFLIDPGRSFRGGREPTASTGTPSSIGDHKDGMR